jgi:virginiamycin B lyase
MYTIIPYEIINAMDIKIFCTVVSLLMLVISTAFLQPQAKKAAASAAPISTNSGRYSNVGDYYTKVTNAKIDSTTEQYSGKAALTTTISPLRSNESGNSTVTFQDAFCGVNSIPHSTTYVTEYLLPQTCEMPLGIAASNDGTKIWYVSTKNGVLGSYDVVKNKFDQEYVIPEWVTRKNPIGYSQVWDLKVNTKDKGAAQDVWFTDEAENAIWRFSQSSHAFEMYKIPGNSSYFGTTYPISIEFDGNNRCIFFVGTFSSSLWIGDITKMRNGTSDGIRQVPIPIGDKFKGIDPIHVTTGSIAFDKKRNAVWISMLAYGIKGELVKYNLKTHSFTTIDLPKELSSPVGIAVDNSDDLWITNAGTSIFYKLKPENGNIVEFVTSKASPRIYGAGDSRIDSNVDSNQHTVPGTTNISKNIYTLPYWIKKSSDGSVWFNELEGNKIARFNPYKFILIEYWIPTQDSLWGSCANKSSRSTYQHNYNNTSSDHLPGCGIANVIQFSMLQNNQIWFTEWSENKIGKLYADKKLPFSITTSQKELTVKRGESAKINLKIKTIAAIPRHENRNSYLSNSSFSSIDNIRLVASGTFTSTGDLDNSTAFFDKKRFSLPEKGRTMEFSFTFTPSLDSKPGQYILMVGAENDYISCLKAIKTKVL